MKRSLRLASVVASCLAVGCGGADSREPVKVPNLIGDKVEDAEHSLNDKDLRWRFRLRFLKEGFSEVLSEPQPDGDGDDPTPDRVLKQTPAPDTRVAPKTVITLETRCSEGCG